MIHEVGVELQAALRSRGCPFAVFDREGTRTTTYARERIVIEHDEAGDRFGPVRSQHANPKHRMTRTIGCKLTIYAQSAKAGAIEFEHRRRAEHVLDLVICAMHEVASKRKNTWTPTGGRFVQPEDLDGSERYGGAVYELSFTFDRGVFEQTWAGETSPTATLGGEGGVSITSTTNVRMNGGPEGGPVETGCGG